MHSLNKNMTEMIQQSAIIIAIQTKKQNPETTSHRICGDMSDHKKEN